MITVEFKVIDPKTDEVIKTYTSECYEEDFEETHEEERKFWKDYIVTAKVGTTTHTPWSTWNDEEANRKERLKNLQNLEDDPLSF